LIEQFFVNKYDDIILKFIETFPDKYRIEHFELKVLSCTAEQSTISAGCDFCKHDVDKEQLQQNLVIFGMHRFKQSHSKGYCETVHGKANFS